MRRETHPLIHGPSPWPVIKVCNILNRLQQSLSSLDFTHLIEELFKNTLLCIFLVKYTGSFANFMKGDTVHKVILVPIYFLSHCSLSLSDGKFKSGQIQSNF